VKAAEALWQRLEGEARRALEREGYSGSRIKLQRFAELRYLSQSHELSVPWQAKLTELAARFEEEHECTYGHRGHDGIVELVNLHLVASGLSDRPRVPEASTTAAGSAASRPSARSTPAATGRPRASSRGISRASHKGRR